MKNDKLPKIKYKVNIPREGRIRPGIDAEPTITIKVSDGTIRYHLVSFLLEHSDEPTSEGNVKESEKNYVDSWVCSNLPGLLAEAHLHHIVKFDKESECYYDFLSETLYHADGCYEKKGSTVGSLKNAAKINGEPIKLPKRLIPFVEKLTQHPKTPYPEDTFFEIRDEAEAYEIKAIKGNLATNFSILKRYDSSIDAKFKRETTGSKQFIYLGEPQEWYVGENVKNENLTIGKTFETIFKTITQCEIIAIFDTVKKELIYVTQKTDVTAEETIAFFGLNTEFLEPACEDLKQLVYNSYCESPDALKSLLSKCCTMMDAVWRQIAKNVEENLSCSLGASTFCRETGELPKRLSDLNGYRPARERLNNLLKRICPAIEKTIKESKTGAGFFGYYNFEVTSEKAIDYIVALILSCFSDCQTSSTDEELMRLRGAYQKVLRNLIEQKFAVDPPNSGNASFYDESEELRWIRRRLFELQEQAMSDRMFGYVSFIAEILNSHIFGFNDENSLLSPSTGREL